MKFSEHPIYTIGSGVAPRGVLGGLLFGVGLGCCVRIRVGRVLRLYWVGCVAGSDWVGLGITDVAAGVGRSGGAVAGGAVAGGAAVGDAVAVDAVAGDAVAGDAVAGDAVAGDAVAGLAAVGVAAAGGVVAGDAAVGDAAAGDTVACDAVAGGVVAGGPRDVCGAPMGVTSAAYTTFGVRYCPSNGQSSRVRQLHVRSFVGAGFNIRALWLLMNESMFGMHL